MRFNFLDINIKNIVTSFSLSDFFFIPDVFFISSIVFLLIFSMFIKLPQGLVKSSYFSLLLNINLRNFTIFILGLTFILYSSILFNNFTIVGSFFNSNFFVNNTFTTVIKLLTLLMSIIVVLVSSIYFFIEKIIKSFEYYILLLLAVFSGFCLLSSNDLILLYVTLEMLTLTLYVLASSKQNSLFSIESGLKYFILGSVASGFLLFGSSLFYGIFPYTNFNDIVFNLDRIFFNDLFMLESTYNIISLKKKIFIFLFIFFITFLFKLSIAPFHMWSPDVYEGAPTVVTFFFSVVIKLLLLGIVIRLLFNVFFFFKIEWQDCLVYVCMFSMLIGSYMGILQKKLKRLIAFSSITNVGFLLIGFIASNVEGLVIILVYFLVYFFMNVVFFVYLVSLRYFNNFLKIKNIYELVFIFNFRNNFLLTLFFVLNFFSLIGIPPLAGFFSKFLMLVVSFENNLFWVLFIALVSSVISGFYYLRVIRLAFFPKGLLSKYSYGLTFLMPIPFLSSFLISLSMLFNILFFFELKYFYMIFYNAGLVVFYDNLDINSFIL